jgi:glucose/arabinose dehydrogenase
MAFLDNDILILNKSNGTVVRLVNRSGTYQPETLLDVNVANKQERGLLGVAISKENNTINGYGRKMNLTYFFLYYTESKRNDGSDICHVSFYCDPSTSPLGNRVYRYELEDLKLQNPKLLLDLPATPAPGHNGGFIRVGPDNNLYVTVGDLVGLINDTSSTRAQNFKNGTDPDGRAGILRLTQDGKQVKGIIGDTFPLDRYFAYGIRNSFGIDFDPVSGYLWDTENGPSYGDEINLVKPGFNSGWNIVQGKWRPVKPGPDDFIGGDKFTNPKDLVDFGGKGKYSNPEFTWKNTVGPSAIVFLNSDKLGKKYENDLLVASFNLGIIFHFDLNSNRTELDLNGLLNDMVADNDEELEDIIFLRGLGGITDIEVGPDGYLYVLSNYVNKATIFRITPT